MSVADQTRVLRPTTEDDVSQAVRAATSLKIVGGGTRGVAVKADHTLSVAGLSGVTLYEPGALTVVAQAGTPLAEIEAALAAENQRLPFEPADYRGLMGTEGEPTIGGIVSAGISGPRRIQVGAARDFLLGVRFVDGMGQIVKNGGRVMKNVTGYDLVKLLAGSHGTLGILTEVALKVLPEVEARAGLSIHNLSDLNAVAALSKALGSPFEVSGAAHAPVDPDGHPVTMLRIEGFTASVAYRAAELQVLLGEFGDVKVETDAQRVQATWRQIRDVEMFHGTDGDVWKLSVKPSNAPDVVAQMPAGTTVLYDWGGGLIWANCGAGTDLRAAVAPLAGHATLVRGSGQPRFQPENAVVAQLAAGLRTRFDPRGVLNPGLMG